MGAIGRWIDARCKAEPDVMRRVLGRKFGDLDGFIGADNKCGCLVGSWLLESGRPREIKCASERDAYRVGIRVYVLTLLRPYWSQWGVWTHHGIKRTDAFVIRLLKQRIRKSLGIAPENRPVQHLESVSR